jgi:hypothetical protein
VEFDFEVRGRLVECSVGGRRDDPEVPLVVRSRILRIEHTFQALSRPARRTLSGALRDRPSGSTLCHRLSKHLPRQGAH